MILSFCNSIKNSTSLPSTQLFPHSKLKDKLKWLISPAVFHGQCRYKYLVLGMDKSNFVKKKKNTDSSKKFCECDIIKMFWDLIDNIFILFGGHVFQDSQHTYGYKLCSFSSWLVPLFVRGRLHTRLFQENRKES